MAGTSASALLRPKLGLGASLALSLPIAALIVINLLPLFWGMLTSIKPESVIFAMPPRFVGFGPTNVHYERVFVSGFAQSFMISLFYSGVAVVMALACALPAAYAFDRFDFPFRQSLFLLVVAAIIDGATRFGVLRHVMLPLSRPALGAAGTLAFVGSWNEFVAGSVMIDAPWLRPIQPLIYSFIGFFGREWGPLTAAATLAIVPILIVFALLGRLIVSGLTKGSVKG
jgi:ABC-type glycerol-3-phosphate transport system permease component